MLKIFLIIFATFLYTEDYRIDLLDAHNHERGNNELFLDEGLNEIAQNHAQWMADHHRLSHRSPDGSPFDRARKAGIDYCFAENIAEGQEDVKEVMRAWMTSWGHRANIKNKQYNLVGFGMAKDKNRTIYWCVDFGTK